MAKLEGVKTLDMVDGEITKVEYDGAVYEKVEEKAQAGDLLFITYANPGSDTLTNKFYEVVDDQIGGGITYFDEEGDACFVNGPESNVFRKISAQTSPILESVNAKVDVISERVSSLAERVDALESSEKEAKELTILKKGDRVKTLANGEDGDIKAGEIGIIEDILKISFENGDPYYVSVETDDDFDYFRPQDLELVTEEEEVLKVGEYAKVISDYYIDMPLGTIVKVTEIDQTRPHPTKGILIGADECDPKIDEYNCFMDGHLVKATYEEVEQAKREAIFAKLGRKPGEFKKGDIVKILAKRHACSRNKPGDIGEVVKVEDDGGYRVNVESRNKPDANGNHHLSANLELIAPVEARVDSTSDLE